MLVSESALLYSTYESEAMHRSDVIYLACAVRMAWCGRIR